MPAAPLRSIVFLAVHLAVLAMAAPAHAAASDAPAARSIALPAGPLGRNLSTLAVEAGIALSFDPALTAGLSSPALSGSYTPREALTRLLAGSGLELVGRSDGSHTLQKVTPATAAAAATAASAVDEKTLAVIRVRARRAADGSTEGTGSYTSRVTSIASKTDQSFREIPQSVSVITRQQLDDQDVKDIGGAMALTPGITSKRVNGHAYNFYSRGFQIDSMQIDGGAPFNIGSYTATAIQDMAMYDRVEVMRGASGLLSGAGDPGGIINLARKKPLEHRQLTAGLSAG
ncbi:MAG: TonB-dependent receptor plug domain-containing protein, partial [Janthinobacterium sp.]